MKPAVFSKIFFFLFLLFPLFAGAQTGRLDSLQNRLKDLPQDSNRVKTLNSLSDAIRGKDPVKSLQYAEEAFTLAKKIDYGRGLMIAYQYRADALRANGKAEDAIALLRQGILEGQKIGMWRSVCSMCSRIGYAYFGLGKYSEGLPVLQMGAHLADSLGYYEQASDAYRGIGMAYVSIGDHDTATVNYLKGIDRAEKAGKKDNVGYIYVMLGNSQQYQGDSAKAMESFSHALGIFRETKNNYGIAGSLISIGNMYLFQGDYENALKNYNACLEIRQKEGNDVSGIASAKENIGIVLLKQNKPGEALNYFLEGIESFTKMNDQNGIAGSLNNIGNAYAALKRYPEAETNYQKSIAISRQYKLNEWLKDSYKGLSELYFNTGKFRESALYKDSLAQIKEMILGEEHAARSKELEAKYQNRKKEEEISHLNEMNAEKDKVQQQQELVIIAVSAGLGIVLLLSFFLVRVNAGRKKANSRLAEQNKIIAEKNKDITDSITYASRIQRSVLPDEQLLRDSVSDYFILNKPRDIVSGDFYWLAKKQNRVYIAVADCTGHGVPGALVSVIGINMLNKAIEMPGEHSPSEMLEMLHTLVSQALHKGEVHAGAQDGMDIALLCIDKTAGKAWFSGAARPLYYITNGKFESIRGDRYSIAGEKQAGSEPYSQHEISLEGEVKFYMSSDGYADQFGESTGKKFLSKRFQELLSSVADLPMEKQKTKIENAFNDWKGNFEQVDDVLVIGIRA